MTTIRGRFGKALAVLGVGAAVMLPSAALAQEAETYGNGSSTVASSSTLPSDPGNRQVSNTGSGSESGSLPFTGGDAMGLAFIGAVAVGGGVALARSGKRRANA